LSFKAKGNDQSELAPSVHLSLAVHRRHLPAEVAVQQASLSFHVSILGVIGQELLSGGRVLRLSGTFTAALIASIKGGENIATSRLRGHRTPCESFDVSSNFFG
jgi:hypothetical protein